MSLEYVVSPTDEEIERLFPSNPVSPISSTLSPVKRNDRAFSILKSQMKKALDNALDPAIYVMSADCGTGKSSAVQQVLADWKAAGFAGSGGAIIFVNTLAEIDPYVRGAKLDKADYAVLASDPVYAAYGAGRDASNRVPVLFASHSMARRRLLEKGTFAATECFHFNGKPRALRAWEEAFLPVEYSSFEYNDLLMVPGALKGRPAADIRLLEALIPDRGKLIVGATFDIPLS